MKGQWYIVAAVMFSFSLLTIFNVFNGYSSIDFTSVAKNDEDVVLLNVVEQLDETVDNSEGGDANLQGDVKEFLEMAEGNLVGKGYFFDYNYTISPEFEINQLEISGENLKVKYDETYYQESEPYCAGTADDCSEHATQTICEYDPGCSWYPGGGSINHLSYDNFSSGWGSYHDGGDDCHRVSDSHCSRGYCARINDNNDPDSSFYTTTAIAADTNNYNLIKVDFEFEATEMETYDDWFLRYYNGTAWVNRRQYIRNSGTDTDTVHYFRNDRGYSDTVLINESAGYSLTDSFKVKFICDAGSSDEVYIDNINVTAYSAGSSYCSGTKSNCNVFSDEAECTAVGCTWQG